MLLTARTRFLCLLLTLFAAFAANAQDEQPKVDNQTAATNYEVRLQMLVSTDQPADKLAANLQPIEKQLRRDFRNVNYQTAFSLVNRAAERGTLELKGVNPLASGSAAGNSGFYEAALQNIRTNPARANEVRIDFVRFGLRVPILNSTSQVVTYEQIGITAKPLSVVLGEPTIVGTLTTPRPNELVVLVLTIESGDAARNNRTAQKD